MTKTLSTLAWVSGAVFTMFALVSPVFAATPVWDVSGAWVTEFEYLGSPYPHDMTLAQDGVGGITGGGGYLAGAPHTYEWIIDSGAVSGDIIHLETHYTLGAACAMIIDGVVAPDGLSMSGTWSDNCDGARGGTWTTNEGSATLIPVIPVEVLATSKNQCKKGGWMNVVDSAGNGFKNQGDCVSFVATAGKNLGAGN